MGIAHCVSAKARLICALGALLAFLGCGRAPRERPSAPRQFYAHGQSSDPVAWAVPHWYIDPGNSTAVASDVNGCVSAAAPCRTYAEIGRRWGTPAPTLHQATVVEFLSDQSDLSDPIVWRPLLASGGQAYIMGQLVPIGTATLLAVTPKSHVDGAPLRVTASNIPAQGAIGTLLVNATHSAQGWVDSTSSGTSLTLTQPFSSAIAIPPALFPNLPSEVDTYAEGDTVIFEVPTKVYLADFEPLGWAGTSSLQGILSFVGNVWVPDPLGPGAMQTHVNRSVDLAQTRVDSILIEEGTNCGNGQKFSHLVNDYVIGSGMQLGGAILLGGSYTFAIFAGSEIDGDAIVHSATIQTSTSQCSVDTVIGAMYSNGKINVLGTVTISPTGTAYVPRALYGAYTLNVDNSRVNYTSPASGDAGAFEGAPVLQLQGGLVGWSVTAGQPAVVNGNVPLSPQTLDAPAGATGFGGTAWHPGGSIFTSTGF